MVRDVFVRCSETYERYDELTIIGITVKKEIIPLSYIPFVELYILEYSTFFHSLTNKVFVIYV